MLLRPLVRHSARGTCAPGLQTAQKCRSKANIVAEPDSTNNELPEDKSTAPEQQDQTESSETSDKPTATEPVAESSEPESSESASQQDSNAATEEDELPEEEELTPELVEEEAIRGDFMLRWAAVFLAILFGCSQIGNTSVLTLIRSGDAMRSGSFLPLGDDLLSYSLEGESTANVSWMYDHIISLVWASGAGIGLTVFKALVAGFVAWLLGRISVNGMPTWWSSICVVLAMGACSIDFVPTPDLATVVGMTVVLYLLHKQCEGELTGFAWKPGATIAIWCNFDSHAFLGVIALALFAVGVTLRKSMSSDNGGTADSPGTYWTAAAIGFAALLVNPSPLASLLTPLTTYTVEYSNFAELKPVSPTAPLDGRTEYFSVITSDLISGFEFAYVAGAAVMLCAIVVLAISRSKSELPWITLLFGFSMLAMFRLHELPAAALVAAVAAGLAGQRWYGRTFQLEYSIKPSEVLFSRGGRAATVLGFAAIAYFAATGNLPTRTAIGTGFTQNLQTTIDATSEQLEELADEPVFHTTVSQGDLLIWHGRKSFVDSRLALFGRHGDDDSAITRFDVLRHSIVHLEPTAEQKQAKEKARQEAIMRGEIPREEDDRPFDPQWKETLDEWGCRYVMLRLTPPTDTLYNNYKIMMQHRDFAPIERGSASAVFALMEKFDKPPRTFSTRELVFRNSEEVTLEQPEFAREPDFYQKWIYTSANPEWPAALLECHHAVKIEGGHVDPELVNFALSNPGGRPMVLEWHAGQLLAVRKANEVLSLNPQNPLAHHLRALAYEKLAIIESVTGAGQFPLRVRYMQVIAGFRQAVQIAPDNPEAWEKLSLWYQRTNRPDLALEALEKYIEYAKDYIENELPDDRKKKLYDNQEQLTAAVNQTKEEIEQAVAELAEDPEQRKLQVEQLVFQLEQSGFVKAALEIVKENRSLLENNLRIELRIGTMMLEAGEFQEGTELLDRIGARAEQSKGDPTLAQVDWQNDVMLGHLIRANYLRSTDLLAQRFRTVSAAQPLSPLVFISPIDFTQDPRAIFAPDIPYSQWLVWSGKSNVANDLCEKEFLQALFKIESGNTAIARDVITRLITDEGNHRYYSLATLYLNQLTDEAADIINNSRPKITPEEFEFPEIDDEDDSETTENEATEDAKVPDDSAKNAGDAADENKSATPDDADQE